MRHPPPWQQAYACVDYAYPWKALIARWKFAEQPALAHHLAGWMLETPGVEQALRHADVILPIPTSHQRMRERGYHPAAQLAKLLSPDKCNLYALQRLRHTPSQSQLTRSQRLRNLRGAFGMPPQQSNAITDRQVLLVDDVMTTGATLTLASKAVLQAGAAKVSVLSFARTP